MTELPDDAEQILASMTDGEFAALTAKVRASDTAEQLRTEMSKHISGDRLEAVLGAAHPAAFVDDTGAVDATKVATILGQLFGMRPTPPRRLQNSGQGVTPLADPMPGDRGKAAAQKRFNNAGAQATHPAAQRRFGQREEQK